MYFGMEIADQKRILAEATEYLDRNGSKSASA